MIVSGRVQSSNSPRWNAMPMADRYEVSKLHQRRGDARSNHKDLSILKPMHWIDELFGEFHIQDRRSSSDVGVKQTTARAIAAIAWKSQTLRYISVCSSSGLRARLARPTAGVVAILTWPGVLPANRCTAGLRRFPLSVAVDPGKFIDSPGRRRRFAPDRACITIPAYATSGCCR